MRYISDPDVQIVNANNVFRSPSYIYALDDDIKFSKPIEIKKAWVIMLTFIIWVSAFVIIFGIKINIWYGIFLVVPPMLIGNFINKPVVQGRTIGGFARIFLSWRMEPRGFTDWEPNDMREEIYEVDYEYLVSRRKDMQILADFIDNKRVIQEI